MHEMYAVHSNACIECMFLLCLRTALNQSSDNLLRGIMNRNAREHTIHAMIQQRYMFKYNHCDMCNMLMYMPTANACTKQLCHGYNRGTYSNTINDMRNMLIHMPIAKACTEQSCYAHMA